MDARLNITVNGQNGDLPDFVAFDASDLQIKTWATEAVAGGGIPGIDAVPGVSFENYVVDRFPARDDQVARLMLRPKTAFG